MHLRTSERQQAYEADWGFASIVSALQAKGVSPERAARALRLLRHIGVPDTQLGSALLLAFGFMTQRRPEILVVEDEEAVRNVLALGLRSQGLAVRLTSGGQQAAEVYRRHHHNFSLALLDVQMPGLDGPQTLALLRQVNPAIRCVFMSGSTGTYSTDELLALGAVRVLAKPFGSLAEVAALLRELAGVGPI
jgi:CheY-like chemotaxis protein